MGQLDPEKGRSSTHELGLAVSATLLRRQVIPLPIHKEERAQDMFGPQTDNW